MVAPSIGISPGDAASFQQTYFSIIESFLTAGNYLEDLALKQSQKATDTAITITQGGKVLYGQENGKKIDYLFGPLSQQIYPDLPQKLNQIRQAQVGSVSTLPELRVELNNQIVLETDSKGVVKVNELVNLPFDKLPELFQRIARTREKNQSTAIEESIIKALKTYENQPMKSNEPLEDAGLELPPDFDEAILFSDPALNAQATELFGPPPEPSTPATDIGTQESPNRDTPAAADIDVEKTPSWDTSATDAGKKTPSRDTLGTDVGVERTNSQNTPTTDSGERTPNRDTQTTDGRSKLENALTVPKSVRKARPQLGQTTNVVGPVEQVDIEIPISRQEAVSPPPVEPVPISTEETVKNSTTPPAPISKEEAVPTPPTPISRQEAVPTPPTPISRQEAVPLPPASISREETVPTPPASISREETVPTPPASISREETPPTSPAPNSPINIPISTSEGRNNRTSVGALETKEDRTGLERAASIFSGLEDTELKALLVEQIKATRELQQQFAHSSNQFQELVSSRLNSQKQTNWWEQLKESLKGLGEQVSSKLSGMATAFHSQQTEHRAATTLHELFQSQVGKDATTYLSEKYSIQRQGNSYTLADGDGNSLLKWKSTPFGVSSEPASNKLDSQQLDSIKQLHSHLQSGKISDEWVPVGSTETSQFKRTMSIATNLIGAANKLGSNISLDGQAYKIEATASGCKVTAKDGRGEILNFQDGHHSSSMSSRDLAYFEKMVPVLTQQYAALGNQKAALGNQKSSKKHGMEH